VPFHGPRLFVIDVAVMIFGSFLSFFRLLTFGLYPLISLAC